jgi:hypothetical protein
MPKVSTKHVQRRIAELDNVAQPKRPSVLKRVLALIILAIIALAAFFSADRTSSDFLRLTLKQGPQGQIANYLTPRLRQNGMPCGKQRQAGVKSE